ncbi:MAG TPA: hypothetical protein VH854_06095 [Thermoanaerobaculia bacterium]|jgi:hypothetical protein|nr:hypothetical protein [Thermoanaerobaculia bacterium]
MTWPQAPRLNDGMTDLWDAKLNAWIVQWDVYQGLRHPLELFQAPFFHPARYVLAFSENLVGAAVFGVPLLALGASTLLNYNALLLLGMFLSALAAWALAREVTGDPAASLVAGLVYAFPPWRLSQMPHFQFQWGAFLCLALLFLIRYLRGGVRRDLVLYGIAFAWNALTNVHYAIFSAFVVGAALLVESAAATPGPERAARLRGALIATLAGALVFAPFALAYARASELYGMVRRLGEMRVFSGQWTDFLSAGERNRTWGALTARWFRPEGDFFPGLTALALAGVALVRVRRDRPAGPAAAAPQAARPARGVVRALDAACAIGCLLWLASLARPGLQIGPLRLGDPGRILVVWTALAAIRLWIALPGASGFASVPDWIRRSRTEPSLLMLVLLAAAGVVVALGANTPYYRFLFVSVSRIFGAIRAPSRGIVLFDLALAVLAAWGLAAWTRWKARWSRLAIVAGAVAALGFEYRGFPLTIYPYEPWPAPVYGWLRGSGPLLGGGAVVEWPIGPVDAEYVVRQADHRQPLVNGYSGFFPPDYLRLQALVRLQPVPDGIWRELLRVGTSMLIYHSGDLEPSRRALYRHALRGGLDGKWLSLARAFRGVSGTDFAFRLADPSVPRSAPDAASRAELDAFFAIPEPQLDPPIVGIEFAGPVAPGAWQGGWALARSGVATIRIESERGVQPALLHMRFPSLARAFPDFSEAVEDRGGFGFAIPALSPGRHTLTFTVTANDGGVTVVTRAVVVVSSPTRSPS